jgi:hypothetical protein
MIRAREIDEYRGCDLSQCSRPARWEFTVRTKGGRPRRVYVCERHQIEGFARARDLS